jgi:ribose transport system substrate-binding protein
MEFQHLRTALYRTAALAGAGVILLTGCSAIHNSPSSHSSSQPTKIAAVAGGPNAYFAPWGPALSAAVKQFGISSGTYEVAPTPSFDLTVENSTINSLVSGGANAVMVYPDGVSGPNAELKELADRGLTSIAVGACVQTPSPSSLCLATDVGAEAYYATQELIAAIGGKGNIAFVTGALSDPNTVLREQNVEKAVAQTHGKVHLVQVIGGVDTPTAAPPAVQSLLAAKGSKLQGIVSTNYNPSVALADSVIAHPQYRHIKIIGIDNNPAVVTAIKDGYMYGSVFQNSYGTVYVGAEILQKLVTGGCTVNPNGPFIHTASTNRLIDIGSTLVDSKNVSQNSSGVENLPQMTKAVLASLPKYLNCKKS